ncbi:divisome protein SepX/GlpR [Streptosporangium sp. V21-05]|uniref:divisome protein SepX/GlpR n=1 Tax=Streptosporangium sp. V21-05 TaxID=3446115 RepID=UPI003F530EFA
MSSGVVLYLAIVVMWLCVLVPMWLHRDRNTLSESHKDIEPYAYDERAIDEDSAETLTEPLPVTSDDLSSSSSEEDLSSPGAEEGSPGTLAASETGSSGTGSSGTGSEAPHARPVAGKPATGRIAAGRAASGRRRAELRRRGKQVAKRRRLTLWCVLLLIASVVTAAVQVIPWWGVAPSVVLLGAYMAVLRVTVQIDAERREAIARAHAERAKRARRRAALLEAQRPVAEIIDLAAHRDEIFDQYAETPRRAVGD